MFNLEQSIAEWRRQMADGGIKSPAVLDELESHLREDMGQLVKSGLSTQQAFDTAVQRIGQASTLKPEFETIGETPSARERKTTGVLLVAALGLYAALGLLIFSLPKQVWPSEPTRWRRSPSRF